ncbi:hypothetical protein SAMN05192553_109108 [Cyclobacterium xiamenense]|uniref:Uncharacterized protein n=1 Tax=Cyclobacterium xiamenense TaxID=1297121 RepID=A0A1H7B234_9BACT|nr:hypothetical protein SAMN05192553_109108 [Cyclobacterium xiamenense]
MVADDWTDSTRSKHRTAADCSGGPKAWAFGAKACQDFGNEFPKNRSFYQ